MNKNKSVALAISMTALFSSQSATAESELAYALGMSAGLRDVEFSFDARANEVFIMNGSGGFDQLTTGADASLDFEETLYSVGFSGALIYDRFYASALLEITPQTEETELHTALVNDNPNVIPTDFDDRASDLDRSDLSLTVGFHVTDALSVFSGYKYTIFELDSLEYNLVTSYKSQEYSERGLFVGASYAWDVGSVGTLSLSAAYAYLDVELSDENVRTDPALGEILFGEFAFNGTANGLSYGVQWSARIDSHWQYNVGLKFQSYESNNNITTIQTYTGTGIPNAPLTTVPSTVSNLDTKHSDATFSVGVSYVFH